MRAVLLSSQKVSNLTRKYFFPTVTACIIFHDEWVQVESCINSFRRYYKQSQVILARDTLPPEIPDSLQRFNCSLVPENRSMEYLFEIIRSNKSFVELSLKQRVEIIDSQIRKLQDVSLANKSDYILFLEYDSYVRRKVPVYFDTDIETLEVNKFSSDFVNLVEKITSTKMSFGGWGFVTGVVKSDALRDALVWYQRNKRVIETVASYEPRMMVLDFLTPLLIHFSGGKVGNHNLTTECNRDKLWRLRKTPLLHQYRGDKRKFGFLMRRAILNFQK